MSDQLPDDIFDPFGINPPLKDETPPEEQELLEEDLFEPELEETPQPLVPVPDEAPLSTVAPDKRIKIHEVDYKGKQITDDQKELVKRAVRDIVLYGAASGAMLCRGDGDAEGKQCPYLQKCPLWRYRVPLPVGSDCPIEYAAIQSWTEAYLRELEVDPEDVTSAYDVQTANMMAGLHLQVQRARWGESLNPILEQELQNITPQGAVNIVKVGNFNSDYKEKAIKQLTKMARDSMQTRERKVALTKSGFKDLSKHSADVQERLKGLENREISEVEESVEMDDKGSVKKMTRVQKFKPPDDGL